MNHIIQQLNAERATRVVPEFKPGDTIIVNVKVKEGDDAEIVFSQLMGDEVPPRREFIQQNALTASIDV